MIFNSKTSISNSLEHFCLRISVRLAEVFPGYFKQQEPAIPLKGERRSISKEFYQVVYIQKAATKSTVKD
ncbi:hypothetical protein ACFE6N_06690 [Pedobacter sp. BG31]